MHALTLCLLLTVVAADPWTRTEGPARIEIADPKEVKGRLQVSLSGELQITVSVEGTATMEVDPIENIAREDGWIQRQRGDPVAVELGNSKVRWSQTFIIEPLLGAGNAELKLATLRYRLSAADVNTRETQFAPIPVEIVTVVQQVNPALARDGISIEKDPPPAPSNSKAIWIIVGVVGASFVLLGLGWWRFRQRPRPVIDPVEEIRRELALLAQLPRNADDPTWHASRVSLLVRRFVDQVFSLTTLQQTTAEIVASWNDDHPLPVRFRQPLRDLLERCDLARFTGIPPTFADRQALLQQAYQLLESVVQPATPSPAR